MSDQVEISAGTRRRILKEYRDFKRNPLDECEAAPINEDNNILEWKGFINGPPDTPYAGGKFPVDIRFPPSYPLHPPQIKFETMVYHPNIGEDGSISIEILMDQWSPSLMISRVLLTICALLDAPELSYAVNDEIVEQYLEEPEAYEETAREWTAVFATEKKAEVS